MEFLEGLMNEQNYTKTENGAVVHKTTKSDLLDFFSRAGAYRTRSEEDIVRAFDLAFCEDQLLAMKMLFYFRDIRGGQGERRLFRVILKYLALNHTELVRKNLLLIKEYGRWDDYYTLFDTVLQDDVIDLFFKQLNEDESAEYPSLLGKWLKSNNTSSKESRRLGKITQQGLKLSSREYRKLCSYLRKRIGIIEQKMSSKEWSSIEYDKLPSKAALQYRKAFYRNDENRYQLFLDQLQSGEKKVNSGTLFPYELVSKVLYAYNSGQEDILYNGMWNNLPDYTEGREENSLAVVDTSGSMTFGGGLPLAVAISLGLYLAERNTGIFKDYFITFSSIPALVKVSGSTFVQKVRNMQRANWNQSTNVKSVFDLILRTAIKNSIPQEDMPSKLYIISDMEFNSADRRAQGNQTLFEKIREDYREAGYEMPMLVFWNVNARNDHSPVDIDSTGTQLVSGCSPSIFKSLMANKAYSAYDMMLEIIDSERYSIVKI